MLIGLIFVSISYFIDQDMKNKTSLFHLKENEICSTNPLERISLLLNRKDSNCFDIDQRFNSMNISFLIRYSKSNDLLKEFVNEINKSFQLLNCQMKLIDSESNENDSFNLLIDIKSFEKDLFKYDFIIPMSKEDQLNRLLKDKINLRFLELYKHPSELFKERNPPFVELKLLIDLIGMKIMKRKEMFGMKYSMERIICVEYRYSISLPTRWIFIFIHLILFFYYIILNISLSLLMIKEKNEKRKEIYQIIDIKPILNYLSWSLTSFIIISINSILITSNSSSSSSFVSILFEIVLMKMSINGWIIFKYISFEIILTTFLLLNIQMISYSILMGILFVSSIRYLIINVIIIILIVKLSYEELNGINQIICLLNPFYCFIYLFRYLFLIDRSKIRSNKISLKIFEWTRSLIDIYFHQILSIIVNWILIWYLDKLSPGLISFHFNLKMFFLKVKMELD